MPRLMQEMEQVVRESVGQAMAQSSGSGGQAR
jgi:hypothetical protein